jgi:TolB-like protein/Tfp pilus assembly protein PilF
MASIWQELQQRNVVKVAIALPDWFARVVLLLLTIGFPFALIVSWAFDAKTAEPSGKGKPLAIGLLAITAVAAVVIFLGFDEEAPATAEPEQSIAAVEAAREVLPNSVAVLLCDNLSPNPDDAYFSASIHEEILNQLVKISSLNVIARTSVLKYVDSGLAIPEIAGELNVGAVMECSVRFAGTAIMVTAQLIDPATDSHLWSDTYPGDLSDLSEVFAMQADIAMNIANALQAEFSAAEQARIGSEATDSAEAYTLYLKAISSSGGERGRFLTAAIALDPEFALAHVFRATSIVGALRFGIGNRARLKPIAVEAAEKALWIDPTLAAAHLAIAGVHELDWQRVAAETAYQKALALSPNDPAVASAFARFKRMTGEFPEAIRLNQIAVRLDPNTRVHWQQLGVTYLHAGEVDAAIPALRNALALEPDNVGGANSELANAFLAKGDLAAATEALRDVDDGTFNSSNPTANAWRAMAYERLNLPSDAERFARRAEELVGESPTGSVTLATAYVAIGEYDKAYGELERAADSPELVETNAIVELKANRWGHPVLNEPRFVEVLSRLGFQD